MLKALADLHLSFGCEKPMDIFGETWNKHHEKIRHEWTKSVRADDTVVINGDISWAITDSEFHADIEFIRSLPGEKLLSLGNHDYWFDTAAKFNARYPEIFLLVKGAFAKYKDLHICGTKGYLLNSSCATEHDKKINARECLRLENSLKQAMRDKAREIIVFLHYPPLERENRNSEFMSIIKRYPVRKVVYGHLHGDACRYAVTGMVDGIELVLDAADYVGFKPVDICD